MLLLSMQVKTESDVKLIANSFFGRELYSTDVEKGMNKGLQKKRST